MISKSHRHILDHLEELRDFCTYEEIAEIVGVNQYYIWHMLNTEGYIPPVAVRRKLGIRKEDRPPRIAIRKDDPASAARSIVRNFETEQIDRLILEIERMRDVSITE